MKTQLVPRRKRSSKASAVLVVFMLVALLSAVVAVNTFSLRQLKDEIKLIERKQLRKFQSPIPPSPAPLRETNRATGATFGGPNTPFLSLHQGGE